MKYSRKGHNDRNRNKNRIKRIGQARLVYVRHNPHHVNVSHQGLVVTKNMSVISLEHRHLSIKAVYSHARLRINEVY